MKCATRTALAVGAGYLLGRRRKFKLAVGLSAAAATGGFGGVTGQLLRRGGKLLGSAESLGKLSPQLGEITDMVRGDLLEVGKTAVLTAARGQLDRVSDKLHDRADAIRLAGERGVNGDEARDEAEGEPEDFEEAEEPEEPEDLGETEQAEDLGEEPEDEEPEEDSAPSRRRSSPSRGNRARASAGAPVRRTRR